MLFDSLRPPFRKRNGGRSIGAESPISPNDSCGPRLLPSVFHPMRSPETFLTPSRVSLSDFLTAFSQKLTYAHTILTVS